MNEQDRMQEDVRTYLADEVEFVRSSYRHAIADIRSIERYAITISAAIWSWCAAHLGDKEIWLFALIPLLATMLLGLRAWSISLQVASMRRYLARVEQTVALPAGLGWEGNRASLPMRVRVFTGYLFWLVLHLLSIALALWAWCRETA